MGYVQHQSLVDKEINIMTKKILKKSFWNILLSTLFGNGICTAKAHPGGVSVLEKYHNRDATKAFHSVHHSARAIAMLQQFAIMVPVENDNNIKNNNGPTYNTETVTQWHKTDTMPPPSSSTIVHQATTTTTLPIARRWRRKLFTQEDPIGIHKYLGIFVLLHFAVRYYQMLCTDPSAGLGTRLGHGSSWGPVLCLLPHGLLSISSLIFHTVPRDRVVGQPMIWQEYRIHNIGFGLRSVINAALCAMAIRGGNTPLVRHVAVIGSCISCVMAMIVADIATRYLRSNELESTTATMPYWEGCSSITQKRFKSFYAYCQFMATIGCLTVTNPAFPLAILLAIQLASLLMTLVRKGLLSTRGYHGAYTASLMAPFLVALRSTWYMKSPQMLHLFLLGSVLYQLRCYGVNKYMIWLPVMAFRIFYGDRFLTYHVW
jgi:hypothetical protein